jgi:hypothetical protein
MVTELFLVAVRLASARPVLFDPFFPFRSLKSFLTRSDVTRAGHQIRRLG